MTSNVTSGEGVESDDDISQSLSFMKNTMVTSTMVSGEASETDEEEDADGTSKPHPSGQETHQEGDPYGEAIAVAIDNLEIEDSFANKADKGRRQKLNFKYDSPFHRKLRERNLQMRSSLVEGSMQIYKSASDKLSSSTFYLTKAQTAVEDIAYQSKVILEDLESLDSALQGTTNLQFLPMLAPI